MPTRRQILTLAAMLAAPAPSLAQPARPSAAARRDAPLAPRGPEDVGPAFQRALDAAAAAGRPLRLEPGVYTVGPMRLPDGASIVGEPGLTRLVLAGKGPLLTGAGLRAVRLSGLTLESGAADAGVVALTRVADLHMDLCDLAGSAGHGLSLEGCGGTVERSRFTGHAQAGLFARNSTGLSIRANEVADCGNGGILVWRTAPGEDGTLVQGNRVSGIRAEAGGTGENGNGINIFRAGGVVVSGNRVADCAFSAIRANAGSNVQIAGNQCLRSGETAIYAEFAFEGAVITGNLVDRAAIGISVVNFNEGGRLAVVADNLVRNMVERGPYDPLPPGFGHGIAVEADAAVTGNVIEGVPGIALGLGFGPYLRDVNASGNVIRDCGIGVTVVAGAGPAMVVDNLIRSARRGAVVGFRFAEPATGDLTRTGAEMPRHLTLRGNQVF